MSDEISTVVTKIPYTGEDKREAQHRRETQKTILLLILGISIGIICIVLGIILHTEFVKDSRSKQQTTIINKQNTVDKVDMSGLFIVHKVSKDYRKYFMSYKRYISNKSYELKIQQITFDQFLLIEKGDTLTTEVLNNIQTIQKLRNDPSISNNN